MKMSENSRDQNKKSSVNNKQKSYITAVFFICTAILYPNIKLGICSGNSQQAKNVIIQKVKGELSKNPNIAREIAFPIKTSGDDCVCEFKNGSEIRAITLAQDRGGDGARSWRFNMLLVDEARLVKDNIIEEILINLCRSKLIDYWRLRIIRVVLSGEA